MSAVRRRVAMRAVRQWALELEQLQAGNSKHPLHQIRELHLVEAGNGRSSDRITARGTATRAPSRSREPRYFPTGQCGRIMLEVANVDMRYWQVLMAWGLGWSFDDQAKARKVSKATIAKWFEGGLAIVQFCLVAGMFLKPPDSPTAKQQTAARG